MVVPSCITCIIVVHRRYILDTSQNELEEIANYRNYLQGKSWSFVWCTASCRMMQLCDKTRFIVRLYKTCRSSVLYVTANENYMYLFDRDENAMIDADSMISTLVANRSDSDCMCHLGITNCTWAERVL